MKTQLLTGPVLALAAMLAVAQPQAPAFYEDALRRFERNDHAGAVVQLKNVLKADAANLSAHLLLGKALLAGNQLMAAEVALGEALRLGVARGEVVLPLARVLMSQGRPDELLHDARLALDGLPASTRYDLLLLRTAAATDIGDGRAALVAVEAARAIDAVRPDSWLAEVPARIRSRQFKAALAAADKAVALAPNSAEGHFVRGEALHAVPDLRAAHASYDKTLALQPGHVGARVARAGLLLDLNDTEAAARDIAELGRVAARDPRAVYLRALLAERQGNGAHSRAALQELTALLDPIPAQFLRFRPQTQMLGGLAHHGLGQAEKAKPYLEGVLRAQPGHPVAKVLANIHLGEKNTDRAVELLEGYLRANPGDTQATSLLAAAHMAQGRHGRATQLVQDALKRHDQPQLRTALGLSLVGSARYDQALKELQTAFAQNPRPLQAGYALASLQLQAGNGAAAAQVAEQLAAAHPANPGVLSLLASARRSKGDAAGARAAYQAAAKADAAFVPAQVGLARLDMAVGALPAAAARLNAAVATQHQDGELLFALAELAERQQRLPDARRWLLKADEQAGVDDAAAAIALVDLHLRHDQTDAARDALRRAQAKAPEAVATLMAAARVALAGGDAAHARSSLGRAATLTGQNAPLLTQIALLQSRAGAPRDAAYTLDKALGDRPDYLPAQALRTAIDIRLNELPKAEQRARAIALQQPKRGLGPALLADVAAARGQHAAAVAGWHKAHELDRTADSFMRLFAGTARRDPAQAQRLAAQWLASQPQDATAWRALADTQFDAGNLAGARRSYQTLVALKPLDSEALNNLANVMLLQQDGTALPTAERALARAPGAPHVIGTVGWAAFRAGDPERALRLLREARLRDPANPDTRYFLGSVLASAGSKLEARGELSAALRDGLTTAHRKDAEKLLSTLN